MAKYDDFWLEGIIPAIFTPFDQDGEVDLSRIAPYCEYLLNNDIKAIYVNGGTGEGKSMTLNERKDVLEKWISVSKGRMKIVVHIGAMNFKESKELTSHAVKTGADAIATLPTLFFKPQNIAALIAYCKSLAELAPDLPFYYYHLPGLTGVELNMEDFMQEAKKEIPNLIGLKFSSRDMADMIGVRYAGKFNILLGCDDQLLGGLPMGAQGAIGSLYNFMPAVFQRMIGYIDKGDVDSARDEQIKGQKICRIMYRYGNLLGGNLAALKNIMPLVGLDLGPPREPMRQMTESERKQFKKEINDLGFYEWKPAKF